MFKFLPDNRLIAIGTVAGTFLAAASMIAGGIAYQVRLRDDVTASVKFDADAESRLRAIEANAGETHADVREIKTDVAWIRSFLTRQPKAEDPAKIAGSP
jgi:hypothetical protein